MRGGGGEPEMIRAELSMCERGVSGGRREEESRKSWFRGVLTGSEAGGQMKWNFFFFFPFSSASRSLHVGFWS